MSQRQFEISYRLLNSTSPTQKNVTDASDPMTARRIFEQQNPKCAVVSTPKELRPGWNQKQNR